MSNTEIHSYTKDYVVNLLSNCLDKTLGELDVKKVFDKTITKPKITGIAGDVVEQSIFGYGANSSSEADLMIDGEEVELKTTGIRYSKKEKGLYEGKEPVSITAVKPHKIVKEDDFFDSGFWHKTAKILFVFYLYDSCTKVTASGYSNFPIKGYLFNTFSEEDKAILQSDWEIIRNFIRYLQENYKDYESQYPRISSELRSKLMYLDTAPKWPNKPRFRLKRSVITGIVQDYFAGKKLEQLPEKYSKFSDIDAKCKSITQNLSGKTILQLGEIFEITDTVSKTKEVKSIAEMLIVRMFGGNAASMQGISVFSNVGLIGKSIVITKAGGRTEDTKLVPIDFDEIQNEDLQFEDSSIYDFFASHQLMCIIFEEPSTEAKLAENKFIGFKRISFSDEFIQEKVKPLWDEIRDLVLNGKLEDVIEYDKKTNLPKINKTGVVRSAPNFPKSKDHDLFVRGTSGDSTQKRLEINSIKMYRQDVWIKGTYITKWLASEPFI